MPADSSRPEPLVSIIIVAYGAPDALRTTLRSLVEHTAGPYEVIVVDAGVEDGAGVSRVVDGCPVTYVPVPNRGFGAANNAGIRRAQAPFLAMLNPDVVLHDDVIGRLMRLLEQDASVGCAGPRLLQPDGTVQPFAFGVEPTPRFLLARGLRRLRQRHNDREGTMVHDEAGPVEVEWIAGTCLVTRREVLEAVGLFDERYFLYWEDADWCLRVRRHGWRVLFDPRVTIVHQGGVSTADAAPAHYYRSLVTFYRKWYGNRWAIPLAILLRIYAPLARAIRRRRIHARVRPPSC